MSTIEAINNLGPYALNPRGNLWFKDESTYGHKLLMKMGWQHGKGLGKNENGIKENLSVKFRNTNSGLGYKDDPYANIMKTEYETILKNLNEKYQDTKGQSIENGSNEQDESFSKKSKVVKSKVRYPKLFFGKDVNKYSEKDMKSIFICSLPSDDKETISEDSAVAPNKSIDNGVPEVSETYSSSLSITDYFAKKMEEKKNNVMKRKCNGDLDHQEPFSGPKENQELLSSNMLSKKRKKKSDAIVSPESKSDSSLQQPELESEMVETADLESLSSKKSSKKKIKYSLKGISIVETKSQSDDEKEDVIKKPKKEKRKLSQSVFENDKNIKQKKLNVHENGLSSDDNDMHKDKISCQVELSPSAAVELNNCSKKKSKNKKSTSVTELNAVNGFQEVDESIKNSSTLNFQPPLEILQNETSDANIASTKKKKKRKKLKLRKLKSCLKSKRGSYSLKNVSFNGSVSFKIIDTDYEASYCLDDVSSLDSKDAFENVDNGFFGVSSCTAEELQCDEELTEMVDVYDVSEGESDLLIENNESTEVHEDLSKSEKGCSMLSLPSSKSHHDNTSVEEDQKQEMKAGMCKKLLKSLKKRDKLHCDEELTEIVDKYEVSEVESDIKIENNTSTEVQEDLSKSEDGCSVLALPSSKSPYNNCWVEDQKQALKMKMYKKMLKSLKKHEILRTSNLTSLKGYGNWGFK